MSECHKKFIANNRSSSKTATNQQQHRRHSSSKQKRKTKQKPSGSHRTQNFVAKTKTHTIKSGRSLLEQNVPPLNKRREEKVRTCVNKRRSNVTFYPAIRTTNKPISAVQCACVLFRLRATRALRLLETRHVDGDGKKNSAYCCYYYHYYYHHQHIYYRKSRRYYSAFESGSRRHRLQPPTLGLRSSV